MMTVPTLPFRTTNEARPSVERLQAELAASSYPAVRRLNCYLDQDHVILCGCVPNYFLKQFAQSLLLRLCSGYRLMNHLEVLSDQHRLNIAPKWCQDEELCIGIGNDR